MVSSSKAGLLQDKVTFLPDKLQLTGPQFPLTTNSSQALCLPSCDFILPAHQLNRTRRAILHALLFLSEITFMITNNPSATEETLLAFLVPGKSYCCTSLSNEATSNCSL